jgi:hypothetical protein
MRLASPELHVHWPSVARTTTLFLLASIFLHLFGAKVGGWANGSLGPVATILVGVVVPAWLIVCFPTWFAWRIARPLRLRPLASLACWFSPLVGRHDLVSLRVHLRVEAGLAFPPADAIPADSWTALAAALQAERQGNLARARTLVDALRCLPQESAFPWLARCHGVEALVLAAWARADWQAVLDYAAIGRGRAIGWLVQLARAERGERLRPRSLWLGWLLSPMRRRTFKQLRNAIARASAPPKVIPAPAATASIVGAESFAVDVRRRHVSLLAAASRGEHVPATEVLALASAWQTQLDGAALARLSARALELDVRDPSQQTHTLRASVLGELILLGTACDGLVAAKSDEPGLPGEVVAGLREHLCQQVEVALASINPEDYRASIHPLEAWERWLTLRAAVDRLAMHDSGALFALWNGRVAATAWNWTCAVFNCQPKRAAWVAHVMYQWLADQAEVMGDMRTAVMNRENARIALGA